MTLALTRKEGESLEIWHGEELLKLTVFKKSGGKHRICFDGPRTFEIVRTEAKEKRKAKVVEEFDPTQGNSDCFVRVTEESPMMKGDVLSWQDTPEGRFYQVRLTDGTVLKKVHKSCVRLVRKENNEVSFGFSDPGSSD